jgi:8-oxo-dGTP diphosphatase
MTFVLDLVPHCASVSRDGWSGSHDERPLSPEGLEQARGLVGLFGTGIAAVYSSPALRCRQTVSPLASAAGLEVSTVAGLSEAGDFSEPSAWVNGVYKPMGEAIAGASATGRFARAISEIASRHVDQRVVACSHGDVIPLFLAMTCAALDAKLPAIVGHGGWYRLEYDGGTVRVAAVGPLL